MVLIRQKNNFTLIQDGSILLPGIVPVNIGLMEISFTKMHGLGNDFVVIDGIDQPVQLDPSQARAIADRRLGVGCDQILLLGPTENDNVDVNFRIFNADGGEVAQCGNGARCVAVYLRDRRHMEKKEIIAETSSGLIKLFCEDNGAVRVNMGVPRLDPSEIPMQAVKRARKYLLGLNGKDVTLSAVSMGNPHAVIEVDDIGQAEVQALGPEIQQSPLFPEEANVGFMQIIDREHILLRVYERGAGETLACGSGACAAVVTGYLDGKLDSQVDVGLTGGHLSISWQGEGEPVWMTGPAAFVYEGQIEL
jgi:diaminopimelate epimerase